jgi:hypothetical protein
MVHIRAWEHAPIVDESDSIDPRGIYAFTGDRLSKTSW